MSHRALGLSVATSPPARPEAEPNAAPWGEAKP
jgi:hypothetical protein